jgi:hypothetical protein
MAIEVDDHGLASLRVIAELATRVAFPPESSSTTGWNSRGGKYRRATENYRVGGEGKESNLQSPQGIDCDSGGLELPSLIFQPSSNQYPAALVGREPPPTIRLRPPVDQERLHILASANQPNDARATSPFAGLS